MLCLRLWCFLLVSFSLTWLQTYTYDTSDCVCDEDVPAWSADRFTSAETSSDDCDPAYDEDVPRSITSEACHSDHSYCNDQDYVSDAACQSGSSEDQSRSTDQPGSAEDQPDGTEDQSGGTEDQVGSIEDDESPLLFACGKEPPDNLLQLTTSMLEERDVTHYLKWDGEFWRLGSGTYADVHLGRYMPTGECVVIKRFTDSSIHRIEGEIRTHRYIEEILPNTPRLLGILPTGRELSNASLVFELVPEGITLHNWLSREDHLSAVQWLSVALQLIESLGRLHRNCILHNDLHSKNVLVYFNDADRHATDCSLSTLAKAGKTVEDRMDLSIAKVTPTTLPRISFIDFGFATFRKGKVFSLGSEYLESCAFLAPEVKRHLPTTTAADVFTVGYVLENIADAFNSSALRDIALLCQDSDPEFRPSVRWVVHNIRRLFHHEYRRAVLHPTSRAGDSESPLTGQSSAAQSSSEEGCSSFVCPFSDEAKSLSAMKSTWVENRSWLNHPRRSSSPHHRTGHRTFGTGRCIPELFEDAVSKLKLPYIPRTGDLIFKNDEGSKDLFYKARDTNIYIGHFESTKNQVAIKTVQYTDIFKIRYEAMMNLLLNESGWVPRFYGVLAVDRYDLHGLGIVQEFYAKGVTLFEVLSNGLPVGAMPRALLALKLSSFMHDIHSRHMLINSVTANNFLCACVNDSHCVDIRVIDLGSARGCQGFEYQADLSHPGFSYLAPEVRQNRMTSFASDVFSLCAILDLVLDREAMLKNEKTEEVVPKVHRLLTQWEVMSQECYSEDPNLRPSAFRLKHMFNTFVNVS